MTNKQDLVQRVEDLEARVSQLEEPESSNMEESVPELRGFVEATTPTTHTERALAIAYYLDHHQNAEQVTTETVTEGYTTCRVTKPANMSDVMAQLEKRELLLPVEHEGPGKAWVVSAEGEKTVQERCDSAN